jgi:hypothetical protein
MENYKSESICPEKKKDLTEVANILNVQHTLTKFNSAELNCSEPKSEFAPHQDHNLVQKSY